MKDLSERLWPAFRAEVAEQLEALELLLVRRGEAGVDASADAVNAMFRHFHTIKGGCSMMGFANMGALAHAAEDALDPVRRNERVLDEALVDALLDATDALSRFLEQAVQKRGDGEPCTELIARLHAATPQAGVAASEPWRAPVASAADGREAAGEFLHAVAEKPAALLEAALAEKLPRALPAALKALRVSAERAGLVAVSQLLRALVAAATDAPLRLLLVADLAGRLEELEMRFDVDAGLARAVQSNAAMIEQRLRASVDEVGAALSADDAPRALAAADALLAVALLARLPETTRMARLLCQVLRDMTRRGLHADSTLRELLVMAATLPLDMSETLREDAPYVALAGTIYRRLADAASRAASGADLAALREQLRAANVVRAEWLDLLPENALRRLDRAIQDGKLIAEIEADMEAAADNGAAFIAWLERAAAQIGNQTVFHHETAEGAQRESTRLRFLTAWMQPVDELRRELGRLDPAQRLFRLQVCATGMSASGDAVHVSTQAVTQAPSLPAQQKAAQQKPEQQNPEQEHRLQPPSFADDTPETAMRQPATAREPEARTLRNASTLRVDSDAVDRFVTRIGELVTLRNTMAHALQADETVMRHRRARDLLAQRQTRALSDDELNDLQHLLDDLDERHRRLTQTDMRLQGALGRMQEDVLALRVVPLGGVLNRLPRVVRDLANAQGKQVRFDISGEDVRVDKSLVEVLIEPLMHLVRNAIDHGIETPAQRSAAGKPAQAQLAIHARQQGGVLLIEVTDDGRGLDMARIRERALQRNVVRAEEINAMGTRELAQLIFLPGFSTAEQITEVSGRGVGMDVAKTRIAQVGGHLDVDSQPGQGTTFTLRLPLSVAIQAVVLVQAGGRQLALPDRSVTEILGLPASALQSVQGQACCLLRGAMLPVYALDALLGGNAPARDAARLEIVVIGDGRHRIGLLVERVLGRPEVYIRDVHADIARLPGVGGVSVLGDGDVVLILDGEQLLELALRRAQTLRSLLRVS